MSQEQYPGDQNYMQLATSFAKSKSILFINHEVICKAVQFVFIVELTNCNF